MLEIPQICDTKVFKIYVNYLKNEYELIIHKLETDFYTFVNIKSLSFNDFNEIYYGLFSFATKDIFDKCEFFGDKCYLSFKDFKNKYL